MKTKEIYKIRKKNLERYERNLAIAKDKTKPYEIRKRAIRYASCLAEKLEMIKRPKTCQWCHAHKPLERHHWNYEDAIDVTFLCSNCHDIANHMKSDEDRRGV